MALPADPAMENAPPREPADTFVIRFWVEWTEGGPLWRGSIRHLQTGHRLAFEDLAGACTFIRTCLALPSAHDPRP